jgi:hypothetical protein
MSTALRLRYLRLPQFFCAVMAWIPDRAASRLVRNDAARGMVARPLAATQENPWMAGTRLVLGPASPVPSAGHDDREVKWSAASDRRR